MNGEVQAAVVEDVTRDYYGSEISVPDETPDINLYTEYNAVNESEHCANTEHISEGKDDLNSETNVLKSDSKKEGLDGDARNMEIGNHNPGEPILNIERETVNGSSNALKPTMDVRFEAGKENKKTVSDFTDIKSENIVKEMSFVNETPNDGDTNAEVSVLDNALAVSQPATVVHEATYRENPDTKRNTGRIVRNSKTHERGKLDNDSTQMTTKCHDFESTEVGRLTRHNVKQHTNRHKHTRQHNGQSKHTGRQTEEEDLRNVNEAGGEASSERVTYCNWEKKIEKQEKEIPIDSHRHQQTDIGAMTLDTGTSLANKHLEAANINMSAQQHETLSPRTESSVTRVSSLSTDTDDLKNGRHAQMKHIAKKKRRSNIEDVETLVSRDKWPTSDNKQRLGDTIENIEAIRNKRVQIHASSNEDSGIEKDFDDDNESIEQAHSHDEHDYVHINSLATSSPKRYTLRPVYDAMNTSTALIILNNKYGKHSRLWRRSHENQQSRRNLIDPHRHLKEPTFYLNGDFHSNCTTSVVPARPWYPCNIFGLDFEDRPLPDKIGDHLYEARSSVNPHRHRACNIKPVPEMEPLDFSRPAMPDRDSSRTFAFMWEKVYAELPTRRTSIARLPSNISGKK